MFLTTAFLAYVSVHREGLGLGIPRTVSGCYRAVSDEFPHG